MASRCVKTCNVRRRRDAKKGTKRKAENRNKGTTKTKKELFED